MIQIPEGDLPPFPHLIRSNLTEPPSKTVLVVTQGTSLVDSILAERGLRRRIAVVLPSSAGVPFVVAATDLIATLPSRIIKDLATIPDVRVVPAPLPRIEVSPHIIWHPRTQNAPLCSWLRAVIKEIAAVI